MDRRRKNQLIVLIVLNLGLFLALDFISPSPIVFNEPETPPQFRVTYTGNTKMKRRFFMFFPSESEYEAFNPIQKMLEQREYGKYIKYKVEFLEEIAGEKNLTDTVQVAASMDSRIVIGGDSEKNIQESLDYLEEYEITLITPYLSIERNKINSSWVLSLQPNSTTKAKLYSELLNQEKIGTLIVLSNTSVGAKLAEYYNGEVVAINHTAMLNDTLNSVDRGSEIGVYVEKTSTLTNYRDTKSYNITVYCEKQDNKLNTTTVIITPISSDIERFNDFKAFYFNQTGKYPTYNEALLYDICTVSTSIIEQTRLRPGDDPEALPNGFKTVKGVTGNCTLTEKGDRKDQSYILVNVDG